MSGDFRDIISSIPRTTPSEAAPKGAAEPIAQEHVPAPPPSFEQRVRAAEARLNATEHRMDAGTRDALQHSVEHLREMAGGYRDDEIAEQMLAAFEAQLRREMTAERP